MKTSEFLDLLKSHPEKSLVFEYQPGQLVPANYHITEVKNISIDAVDCGARADSWRETVIQLWESPAEIGKKEFMKAYKALGILNKVDKIKSMDREAEVKFEYSNDRFHTAQLFVKDYSWSDQNLSISLSVEKTDCKAKETCGTPKSTTMEAVASCEPGGGCC